MTDVKASHINTIASIFAKVVRIELSVEDEVDNAAAIETMSTVWSSMEQLEWTRCRLPENLLLELVEKCTSLTEFTQILGRWRNERVTLKSPPPPVPCVLYPTDYTGSRLHTLDIYCSKADTLRTITTLCPYLHTLHLTSPEEGIASVGSALSCVANSRITRFTLKDYADISDTHILCFQHSHLQSLTVISSPLLTTHGVVTVVATLPALHTLEFEYCKKVDINAVMQVPPLCPTLRRFRYIQSTGCGCCGDTICSTLFAKLLPLSFPHVKEFHIHC